MHFYGDISPTPGAEMTQCRPKVARRWPRRGCFQPTISYLSPDGGGGAREGEGLALDPQPIIFFNLKAPPLPPAPRAESRSRVGTVDRA